MHTEIKEVVYISISAMILSLVLTFISLVGVVQRDIAQTRNNEIAGNSNMIQYKEYNKYDKKELVGEEVIESIRMYYDKGVTVYVASSSITQHTYNMTEYLKPTSKQYFSVSEDGILLQWFTNNKTYRSYLIYNSEDPLAKYNRMMTSYRLTPASITGTLQQKYDALDGVYGTTVPNSEVTGILIIDSSGL